MWKDIMMWALGTVTLIIAGIFGFFGKSAVKGITDLLKEMVTELKKLTGISIQHEERLKWLEDARKDHENRIRTLESNE